MSSNCLKWFAVTGETKSTSAPFRPANRKGLTAFNALQIMAVLVGLGACSTGVPGVVIGAIIIAATLYQVVFIPPKIQRGIYIGSCPHCGAEMSATHYHQQVDCPECAKQVAVRDSRFIAVTDH